MNKKFISVILSLLLILNTFTFIPAFAETNESLIAEDVITYPDTSIVVYENNFDKGTVGENIAEFSRKRGFSNSGAASAENHHTVTYSYGVGDNETNVAKFYDNGYTSDKVTRYNDRGEIDYAAELDTDRWYDVLATTPILSGYKKVTTTFRYYFTEAAKVNDKAAGFFGVVFTQAKGELSSILPEIIFYPTSAQFMKDRPEAKKDISGLAPNKWIDVKLEAVYDSANDKVKVNATVDGKDVASEYSKVREPSLVGFYFEPTYGGRVYVDDLKVMVSEDISDNFKAAMEEFSFNDVVAGATSNIQTSVYESWPSGLITSYSRLGEKFDVEWQTSNPDVISLDGTVTRRSYPQKVTLTAKVSQSEKQYAHKSFEVIVAPLDGASDADILNEYGNSVIKASSFSDEVTADSNKITKDLKTLPTRDAVAGIDILWTSSHPEIIDPLTGKVTRPASTGEDTVVTLTAALTKDGSDPVCKTIEYTVVKRTDPTASVDDAMEKLVLTEEDYTKITKNINLPETYGDVEISWDTTGHSQIAQNGAVTRGNNEVTADIIATFTLEGITKTKNYTLTVYPTIERMVEIDVELIDKTGWNALTGDITVPLIGEKYNSILVWSATNDYVKVGENGNITIKRPANSHPEDLSTNLIVTGRLGNVEKDIPIPITILRQADDSTTAQEAADTLNFDAIRGSEDNTQSAVVKNLSLPTGFVYDKSLVVEWTSSNENIVKTNGEVIRPLLGEEDVDITLTAKVKKNYSWSGPVTISFTVKAISSVEELLQDAKNSLIFSKLSSERIDSVTENLTLPSEGKYGTTIEWSCDSKFLTISGNEGIVTRPDWDELEGVIELNAAISYEGHPDKVYKQFNITILENETLEEKALMFSENFNTWTDLYKFSDTTDKGVWTIPDANSSGLKTGACLNPNGSDDMSLFVEKSGSGSAASFVTYTNNLPLEATSVGISTKFFVNEDFDGKASIVVFSTGTFDTFNPRVILNGDTNTIDVVTGVTNGETKTATTLELVEGIFEKGKWNELRFDINTGNKRFNLYLNDKCITENGYVRNKDTGAPFVTSIGIPFVLDSATIAYGMRGIKFSTDAGIVYFDDIYMNIYSVYTEAQRRAADLWEEQFYLNVGDPSNVKKSFPLPDPNSFPGMTVNGSSSHSSIVNVPGFKNAIIYFDLDKKTAVTLTARFYDGTSTYKRKVVVYVYPEEKDVADTTLSDAEAVAADLSRVINYIKDNYDISNLKTSIDFAGISFLNGSKVTFKSSNTNAISDSGQITMKTDVQTATVTITAQKGIATKSEVLDFVIGEKAQNGGSIVSGGGGGGAGGGKPVSSAPNSTPQTGVDITQPDDENKGASSFTDVAKDHWAYDHINYMVENKIMNGVGDGRIEPERTINREEFVKMLVVTLALDLKDAAADFTDVDINEWYAPYVATIKEKGLINGFEDGTFGIGQNISRQDLAVLIYRSASLAKEDVKDTFADDAEIADYAKDAVYTLRDLGIINGKGEGKFEPNASATRAETATMLYKAIKAGLFE